MKQETRFFINYSPQEGCYYKIKSKCYSQDKRNKDWLILRGGIYSIKNGMVFDTEIEANKELKKTNKIIKYLEY